MENIYLIGYRSTANWTIKIGIAADPTRRLRQLQTGNPQPLTLILTIPSVTPRRLEASLHRKYSHYRKTGEWFELPDQALQNLIDTFQRLQTNEPSIQRQR